MRPRVPEVYSRRFLEMTFRLVDELIIITLHCRLRYVQLRPILVRLLRRELGQSPAVLGVLHPHSSVR